MSSRLRTLDSKISFFAFADIITAVSGVLIFVALLLATDLGRPAASSSASATSELERQLEEIQAQQADVDAQNQRLEKLVGTAETAPDGPKLKADIARLRSDLLAEQQKQSVLSAQMSASQAAILARDKALGLTELKASIARLKEEVTTVVGEIAAAHQTAETLQKEKAHVDAQLAELRRREGQLWLIPEKSLTTKAAILVTVAGNSATAEQFNHADNRRQWDASAANQGLQSYLATAQTTNQYVVFLVRPSGIGLFKALVKTARQAGFDVGYDALEENRQVHFSIPPPIDEGTPGRMGASDTTGGNREPGNGVAGGGTRVFGNSTGTGLPPGQEAGGGSNSGTRTGAGNGTETGTGPGGGTEVGGRTGTGTSNGAANNAGAGGAGMTTPGQSRSGGQMTNGTPGSATNSGQTNTPPAAGATKPPSPATEPSWWQRLIAWIKSEL